MVNKKVVVIGGGHGQAAICRGIKNIPNIDITAIVTVADDGGSTGRLRRQFHIPAMGDIRNVMVALAESESLMSSLMNYRFNDPNGEEKDIAGHNLGNLILTAMTDQCGSFFEAIQRIGKVLNVKGKIIPATTQVISLYAIMEDDVIVKGEANIPDCSNHIRQVFYDEDVSADRIRKATTATVPGNIPYIVLKRFGKTNIDGNLSIGYIMEDLSWATTSQLACWPSIRDVEFQGRHVGYWFDLPEKSIVKITVTPKRKDRRINIYGYAGFDLKTIPPQIPFTNICEASHPEWIGQPDFSILSKPQTIQFNTTTRRTTIYFAVAGARNMFDGDYTISIDID